MKTNKLFLNHSIYHSYLFLYDYRSYEFIGEIVKELKSTRTELDEEAAKDFLKTLIYNSLKEEIIIIKDQSTNKLFGSNIEEIDQFLILLDENWNYFDSKNVSLHYNYMVLYTDSWKEELKILQLYP